MYYLLDEHMENYAHRYSSIMDAYPYIEARFFIKDGTSTDKYSAKEIKGKK
jgi:hypothetical protein